MERKFKIADDRLGEAEMELDMGSMFSDPALFLNGEALNFRAGNCFVTTADGQKLSVEFQKQFMCAIHRDPFNFLSCKSAR